MKLDNIVFYISFLLIVIVYIASNMYEKSLKHELELKKLELKQNSIQRDSTFSQDSLISFLEFMNIKHQKIVLAQAKLESGNFNSKLFKEQNNLFGMRHPQSRNNLSVGSKNGYAVYKNWKHSVIDYALYQSSYLRNTTDEEYLKYLSKNYSKDSSYIRKLKQLI